MPVPRIHKAVAVDDHTLEVEFDNHERRRYDITGLLQHEVFAPLSDPALFRSVQVEPGGSAVVWNSEIDLSEYELWVHGDPLPAGGS